MTPEEQARVLADAMVERETAELTAKVEELTAANVALEAKVDAAEVRATAAEAKATTAERELAEFKETTEREKAQAAKLGDRIKELKAAAPNQPDAWFEDSKRVTRVTAMADEEFAEYVGELRSISGVTDSGKPPRETAMQGAPASTGGTGSAAKQFFAARQSLAPAPKEA